MHLQVGKKVLRDEGEAIAGLAGRLGPEFEAAVEAILGVHGRVVVIGVGKSGHVGRKLAASLASTGTPAFFVHGDEALHGDLGMITRDDLAILISNSGETSELLACLPTLRQTGPQLLTITGRRDSTLGRAAHIVLDYGKPKEADPLDLAPTTSSTMTLALGDALAVSVMAARGFTEEQFALYHPGGALGKQLLGASAAEVAAAAVPAPAAGLEPGRVVVFGSFMMDLVIKSPRRPLKGETLTGEDFGLFPGGKGFNQAVTAARQGVPVAMIGRLGQDVFGNTFREALAEAGIDQSFVKTDPAAGTGIGAPVIDAEGDNSIIIVPRANLQCSAADVDAASGLFRGAGALILQREVPEEASLHAARVAAANGVMVVYNPAPAPTEPIHPDLLARTDLLVVNEIEAGMLAGIPVTDIPGAVKAGEKLLGQGARVVVVTLGARGVVWVQAGEAKHLPAFTVNAIDTTGAGDAFIGALVARLVQGEPLDAALVWASAAGALATTRMGALPSMPTEAQVSAFLSQQPAVAPFSL